MKNIKFLFTMLFAFVATFAIAQKGVVVPSFDPSDGVDSTELNALYIAVLAGINVMVTFLAPILPGLKNFSDKGKVLLAVGISVGAVFLFIGKFYGFGEIWQPILALFTAHLAYIIGLKPFGAKTATLPGTVKARERESHIEILEAKAGVTLAEVEADEAAKKAAIAKKRVLDKLADEAEEAVIAKDTKK